MSLYDWGPRFLYGLGWRSRIERKIDYAVFLLQNVVGHQEKETTGMSNLSDVIAGLKAEVTRQTTVTGGVVTLVNKLAEELAAAIAAAQAAGATPEELAA